MSRITWIYSKLKSENPKNGKNCYLINYSWHLFTLKMIKTSSNLTITFHQNQLTTIAESFRSIRHCNVEIFLYKCVKVAIWEKCIWKKSNRILNKTEALTQVREHSKRFFHIEPKELYLSLTESWPFNLSKLPKLLGCSLSA